MHGLSLAKIGVVPCPCAVHLCVLRCSSFPCPGIVIGGGSGFCVATATSLGGDDVCFLLLNTLMDGLHVMAVSCCDQTLVDICSQVSLQ